MDQFAQERTFLVKGPSRMADLALQENDARTTVLAKIPKHPGQHGVQMCISPDGTQILLKKGNQIKFLQEKEFTETPYLFDDVHFLSNEYKNYLLVKFRIQSDVYIALYDINTNMIAAKMKAGVDPTFYVSSENYICFTNASMYVSCLTIKKHKGTLRLVQTRIFKRTHPCYELVSSPRGDVILMTDTMQNFTIAAVNGTSWQTFIIRAKVCKMTFYCSDVYKFAALNDNEITLMEISPEQNLVRQLGLFEFYFIDFDVKDNLCAINFSFGALSSCVIDINSKKFVCKMYRDEKKSIMLHPRDRDMIFVVDDSSELDYIIKQTTLQSKWSWAKMKKVNPLFLQKVFTLCVIYKMLPRIFSTRKRKRIQPAHRIPFVASEIWDIIIQILFLHEICPLR